MRGASERARSRSALCKCSSCWRPRSSDSCVCFVAACVSASCELASFSSAFAATSASSASLVCLFDRPNARVAIINAPIPTAAATRAAIAATTDHGSPLRLSTMTCCISRLYRVHFCRLRRLLPGFESLDQQVIKGSIGVLSSVIPGSPHSAPLFPLASLTHSTPQSSEQARSWIPLALAEESQSRGSF
jgi:hypothetical protein